MLIQLRERRAGFKGFFPVSPVESWTDEPRANDWYIGATIETSRLLDDVEQRFLDALRRIRIFYQFKRYNEDCHIVTIRDWVTGVQQDALYELTEDFGLTVNPE